MNHDVCIVGGGPAGLAAAATLESLGLKTLLVDEGLAPGGQIHRGITDGPFASSDGLGDDYAAGQKVHAEFARCGARAAFQSSILRIDLEGTDGAGTITYAQGSGSRRAGFKRLILATGAVERPTAYNGWTLPGAMTVGAAQILLKASAMVPADRFVIAGSGPLLLLLTNQLLTFGIRPLAILDTQDGSVVRGLRHLPVVLRQWRNIQKGLSWQKAIKSAGIPVYRGVTELAAHGTAKVERITFHAKGKTHELTTGLLLVHEGVIPNTQLTRAIGCRHVWNEMQQSFRPQIDKWGETSLPGVFVAGDCSGINGAKAAPISGRLAGRRIAFQLGKLSAQNLDSSCRSDFIELKGEVEFRPFIDEIYSPRLAASRVSDDSTVCRCEEVKAGDIRKALTEGAMGPDQVKSFTRCGMGFCQGRICGPIVANLISRETGRMMDEVGSYNVRFPLKPVTLAQMTTMACDGDVAYVQSV